MDFRQGCVLAKLNRREIVDGKTMIALLAYDRQLRPK
jgi:hypothetical protein